MPRIDDDLYTRRDGHWKVLPRWVKYLTVLLGLPAWAVFAVSIFLGDIGSSYQMIAFSILASVAALQIVFIFRAYWRMDL